MCSGIFFSLHYSVCMAICCDSIQIDTNFYFLITVFQLVVVTQRVWAEPDKNPTSTIFYRPKPEPEFST